MSRARLFVGIELPRDTIAALTAVGAFVRREVPSWRDEKWVAEQNLHVTLKFIGDVDGTRVAEMQAALEVAVSGARPFLLEPVGLRAIPGLRRASLLWNAYDDPSGDCSRLAGTIDRVLEPLGVEADKRDFRTHVTLVRARRPHAFPASALESLKDESGMSVDPMSVSSFTLFSSTLARRGPVYEVLERWTMSKPSTACDR